MVLKAKDEQVQGLMEDLEAHIATFSGDPDFSKNQFDATKMIGLTLNNLSCVFKKQGKIEEAEE